MNKTLLNKAVTVLMAETMYSAKKVEEDRDKVQDEKDYNASLAKQNRLLKNSIQKFKKESEEKIRVHEKRIDEFEIKMKKEKKENSAKSEKKLDDLKNKPDDNNDERQNK